MPREERLPGARQQEVEEQPRRRRMPRIAVMKATREAMIV
jgi:hypothetical protein